MIPISIKNLIEKLTIFSFKRINTPNIRSEVDNQKASISRQYNNQITKQVNYYRYEKKKKEEKAMDDEQSQQGGYIPLDPIAIDSFSSEIWNKVF